MSSSSARNKNMLLAATPTRTKKKAPFVRWAADAWLMCIEGGCQNKKFKLRPRNMTAFPIKAFIPRTNSEVIKHHVPGKPLRKLTVPYNTSCVGCGLLHTPQQHLPNDLRSQLHLKKLNWNKGIQYKQVIFTWVNKDCQEKKIASLIIKIGDDKHIKSLRVFTK